MTALHLLPDDTLQRSDGTTATLEDDRIVIRAPNGTPVLTVGDDGLTLIAAQGDLRLVAPEGKVVIESGSDVELHAPGTISATSDKAELRASHLSAAAEVLTSSITDARHRIGQWELTADRIVERASHTFRRVDELAELQAGRVRQLVRGAHQLVAGKASVRCDDEVTLDGSQIRLG